MNKLNNDEINLILQNFDITDYNDVKYLCYLNQTCIKMYYYTKPLLKDLVSFFKYKHEFKLLGHYEALKTKDIKIMKYLDSYTKQNYGLIFINYIDKVILYNCFNNLKQLLKTKSNINETMNIIKFLKLEIYTNKKDEIIKNIKKKNTQYFDNIGHFYLTYEHINELILIDDLGFFKYFMKKYKYEFSLNINLILRTTISLNNYKILDFILNIYHKIDLYDYYYDIIENFNMFKYFHGKYPHILNIIDEGSIINLLIKQKYDLLEFIIEKKGTSFIKLTNIIDKYNYAMKHIMINKINVCRFYEFLSKIFNIPIINLIKNYEIKYAIHNEDFVKKYVIDCFGQQHLNVIYDNNIYIEDSVEIIKFCLENSTDRSKLINPVINLNLLSIPILKIINLYEPSNILIKTNLDKKLEYYKYHGC